jgi:serine/threonine-protein kinase
MASYDRSLGDLIAGKYRIVGTLGQGGMGSVYEAVNDAVGKRVAVKLLNANLADNPEFGRRFELEARAAALINHPGIVDVLDFGRDADGSPYIVMEHLQGLTVRALQRAVGPLRAGLATAIVAPALEALAAAHDAGVVHRDLKPANLFLSLQPTQSVRILDFGISKFSLGGEGVTQTGTTLGTPAYMSPEQLLDGRTVGPAADLYSMGAVLYSLLAGRPPFEADSDFAMVAQVLSKPHRPVALVPRPRFRPRRTRRPAAVEGARTAARLRAAAARASAAARAARDDGAL